MKTLKLFALALAVAGILGSEADAGGRRSRRCGGGSCGTTTAVSTCSGGSCGQVVTSAAAPAVTTAPAPTKEAPKTTVTATVTEGSCSTGSCSSCSTGRGRRGR